MLLFKQRVVQASQSDGAVETTAPSLRITSARTPRTTLLTSVTNVQPEMLIPRIRHSDPEILANAASRYWAVWRSPTHAFATHLWSGEVHRCLAHSMPSRDTLASMSLVLHRATRPWRIRNSSRCYTRVRPRQPVRAVNGRPPRHTHDVTFHWCQGRLRSTR